MTRLHLAGEPTITVELRRNARARRLSLRVSQLDGRVTLTLPMLASQAEAQGFLREKEHWVRRQLGKRPPASRPAIGGVVLFQGMELPIIAGRARSVHIEAGYLVVPGDADRSSIRVGAFLKAMARERLSAACDLYADALDLEVKRITLRDTRSRWGSCTSEGNLMFSWRLIMAPPEVLNYVAAHEVAHLIEMNHSPAFWAVVAGIFPDYETPRQWLRKNGGHLHGYRFVKD